MMKTLKWPSADEKKQGLASILYEMEQMFSACSALLPLGQEHQIRALSLGSEIALLESFLVHVRNLDDLFSKPKPYDGKPTILCKHYEFDIAEVVDDEYRERINTYMAHLNFGRGCIRDIPYWDLTRFSRVYVISLGFLSHVRDNPQLVDGKERDRIDKLKRDLKAILDCIPSPGKTDKHSDPPSEAFTTSSDPPHYSH